MINVFTLEGKIKEINYSNLVNKFVVIENENESGNSYLIKIYLPNNLVKALSEKCKLDDVICVRGHIEDVIYIRDDIQVSENTGYIFIGEKISLMR